MSAAGRLNRSPRREGSLVSDKPDQKLTRKQRLAAALRSNLNQRKTQARRLEAKQVSDSASRQPLDHPKIATDTIP